MVKIYLGLLHYEIKNNEIRSRKNLVSQKDRHE